MTRKSFATGTALLAALALLAPGAALAGGFRIPEQGAAAMGQANAFVGQADDPSAVQFNPAGLTQLPGNQIQVGLTHITVKSRYTAPGGAVSDMDDTVAVPPQFYYSNHLGDGKWWLGLGVTSPFGLSSGWTVPSFQFIATKTSLEMVKVNPVLGCKVNDQWSIGFGIDYYQVLEATFENEAMIPGPIPAYQKLTGDGTGFGANVGVLYKASEAVNLGFAYRTGTTSEVSGNIDVTIDALGVSAPGFPLPATVDLNLPATAALGVCWKTSPSLTLDLDLDWTGWSAYDKLEIRRASDGALVRNMPKDYKDTTAYRVGARYELNPSWCLRGGFLIDSTPVPNATFDPRLPDGDRWGLSAGAGYKSGPWAVDFSTMYVNVGKFTASNDVDDAFGIPGQSVDGEYKGSIMLYAVSVGYKF